MKIGLTKKLNLIPKISLGKGKILFSWIKFYMEISFGR